MRQIKIEVVKCCWNLLRNCWFLKQSCTGRDLPRGLLKNPQYGRISFKHLPCQTVRSPLIWHQSRKNFLPLSLFALTPRTYQLCLAGWEWEKRPTTTLPGSLLLLGGGKDLTLNQRKSSFYCMGLGILIIGWRLFCDIKWPKMSYFLRVSRKVMEHAGFQSGEGETEQILKGQLESKLKFPSDYQSWMCLFTVPIPRAKAGPAVVLWPVSAIIVKLSRECALGKNN